MKRDIAVMFIKQGEIVGVFYAHSLADATSGHKSKQAGSFRSLAAAELHGRGVTAPFRFPPLLQQTPYTRNISNQN